MKETEIEDKELGRLVVRSNPRAKRFVFRTKNDAVYVSAPSGASLADVRRVLEGVRGKLLASRQKVQRPPVGLGYEIDAECFKLSLVSGTQGKFLADFQPGVTRIVCPPDTDFSNENLQTWLRKVIVEAMRREAKRLLPVRLESLSKRHGLPYGSVKVNSSQGRWGSCSARKDINLSCYLMLLPLHLIDYVLLHELCHTREMNHGDRFWSLMDRVTDGKALALRQELKTYRTEL